jgi:hypothetical protein
MFFENTWAACGLEEIKQSDIPIVASTSVAKAVLDFDGFGERILKSAGGVPIRGTVENEPAIPTVGGRVRHLPSKKIGIVTFAGTGEGQCIAVGFDDGSVCLCEAGELECMDGPAGSTRRVSR